MSDYTTHDLPVVAALATPVIRLGVAPTLPGLRDGASALAARVLENLTQRVHDPEAHALHLAASFIERAAGVTLYDGHSGDEIGVLLAARYSGELELTWEDMDRATQVDRMYARSGDVLRLTAGGRSAIAPNQRFALGPQAFRASAAFAAEELGLPLPQAGLLLARTMIRERGMIASAEWASPEVLRVRSDGGPHNLRGFDVNLGPARRVLSSR